MTRFFELVVRFPGGTFHGRGEHGAPEWPPSPLRVFQALTAAAARRDAARDNMNADILHALKWLEAREPPQVLAPEGALGVDYRLSVPNNAMDVVANFWARGKEVPKDASPAKQRTMKDVRPRWLPEDAVIRYRWFITDDTPAPILENLAKLARRVVALGWGVDLVVADGGTVDHINDVPTGTTRWIPDGTAGDNGLSIPVTGTLEDLLRHHEAALRRLKGGVFHPPSPMRTFARCAYRRDTEPSRGFTAAFSLLTPGGETFQPFDPVQQGLTVAGRLRHAGRQAAMQAGWPMDRINSQVLGHQDAQEEGPASQASGRLVFLPLPTIEWRGAEQAENVGAARRVLVSATDASLAEDLRGLAQFLAGQPLVDEKTGHETALLARIPNNDRVLGRYQGRASTWTTVTPVILPGYDDPKGYRRRLRKGVDAAEQKRLVALLDQRVEALLRKALQQAGYSDTLAKNAELQWRGTGFLRGVDLASRYGVPDHLKRYPRLHVRICWRTAEGEPIQVPGPVCIGGGRFMGVGLFTNLEDGG